MQVTPAAREDGVYDKQRPSAFPWRSLGEYGSNSCCCLSTALPPQLGDPQWGLPTALLSLQHSISSHKGQDPIK